MFVLDERAKVKKDYYGGIEFGPMDIYEIETRYGCSTREITLYYHQGRRVWEGDVIEFGENRKLDPDEIEQCKAFLKEKVYL